MKLLNKAITITVLISFTLSNISFALDNNSFKLSPPSKFSNMEGLELKEAAQIQIGVRKALAGLHGPLNIESLRSLGVITFAEKTVFTARVSGKLYFDRAHRIEILEKGINTKSGSYII